MKPKVYLETTIPSYLTAWPSRDLVRAAHQQITREWWQSRRNEFDLFISQFVIQEVTAGDSEAAAERVSVLEGVPMLEVNEDTNVLAQELIQRTPLPSRAIVDAFHIAVAVIHGMDYLLTWNCSHLANATLRGRIESISRDAGYQPPVICTPEELME
jgi:hypothetical protein